MFACRRDCWTDHHGYSAEAIWPDGWDEEVPSDMIELAYLATYASHSMGANRQLSSGTFLKFQHHLKIYQGGFHDAILFQW